MTVRVWSVPDADKLARFWGPGVLVSGNFLLLQGRIFIGAGDMDELCRCWLELKKPATEEQFKALRALGKG